MTWKTAGGGGFSLRLFGTALAVLLADQITKFWILSSFRPLEVREVIPGFFNLVLVHNTGAAFGLLAGERHFWRQVFFIAAALAALVLIVFAWRSLRGRSGLYGYALGLITGGAVGNLLDRLRFGAVVDFLDFYLAGRHWPAFNVADSGITIGVGIFLLASCLDKDPPAAPGGKMK